MQPLLIDPDNKLPKVAQIEQGLIRNIEKGILKKNERLPSITDFSKQHKIARDTVEKAYNRLKEDGYLVSVPGKGNYVAARLKKVIKILMVLNKLSPYKKEVYDAFVEKLGAGARVDLQIHNYDPKTLQDILDNNRGSYHYYVVMPHFFHHVTEKEYMSLLQAVDPNELIILDRKIHMNNPCISVYQDFKMDIYNALTSFVTLFERYKSLTVIFPEHSHHPVEIIDGIQGFCKENKLKFKIEYDIQKIRLKKSQVYISLVESELAELIKKIKVSSLKIGQDIGVISFNETVLNELLDITSISTNFKQMGQTAAKLILTKQFQQIHNPFQFIRRASL